LASSRIDHGSRVVGGHGPTGGPTLLFTLIALVLFVSAMAYMIWQVNTGRAILPGGDGGGN
jgi:hypothetical protein